MNKYLGIISDRTKHAQDLANSLLKSKNTVALDTNNSIDHSKIDFVVVVGGDGTMLHAIHKYMHLHKPFYGINKGNIGFLMNKSGDCTPSGSIEGMLDDAITTNIYPLEMDAITIDDQHHLALAINEVSLLRQTHQSAKIEVSIDHKIQLKNLISDGIMVATPSGSTAYNLSAGGPILPIQANLLALTAISPFRPRRWHGALLHDDVTVSLKIIDPIKRPVSAVADFYEIRNISSVQIKCLKAKKIRLLFNSAQSFEDRIIKEQFLEQL